ncbi:hypothetical protein AVEN_114500-1 [Araneus ventricosus]|uniref:Uncharacterized protein n=1 Tax=Araneus ventricosus TaxID=182803 RepID=A0A4Y2PHW5_ARAVE|nr:hypothetical protein AVEN_114500-1 [Araneus ventricosus]
MSLQRHKEPGQPDHMDGVDKKLADKEERTRLPADREEIGESKMFPLQHPRRHTNHWKKIPLRILVKFGFRRFPNTDRKHRTWDK